MSTVFPFGNLSTSELTKLSFNSDTDCLCSEQISKIRLDSLPCIEVCENLSNIPSLNDIDSDQCLPPRTNFKYYSVHDFHSNNDVRDLCDSQQSLSTLHLNIRSISRIT